MVGQPAVADTFLSFLPHRCKTLRGAQIAVDEVSMNPGFWTPTAVNRNATLQSIIDRRVLEQGVAAPRHAELRGLRFALVDLTGTTKPQAPEFAGHKDLQQGGLGSMAKMACMFAAFQLKFDLEEIARLNRLTSETELFAKARRLWQRTQQRDPTKSETIFAARPRIERLGKLIEIEGKRVLIPAALAHPDLEQIFSATPSAAGGMDVRFKGSDRILVDTSVPGSPPSITDDVRRYVSAGGGKLAVVRRLSFAERMFLMLDESDNAASHSCIENVSYLYIASCLWQSDLYRPARGGGLWEASTHDSAGQTWILPPVPQGGRGVDFVSGTAASLAALLTLVEQGRLVNAKACEGMRQLLSKRKAGVPGGSFTRSFLEEGLAGVRLDRIHSKLGLGQFNNDGAIIERTITSSPAGPPAITTIRYVATVFDEPRSENGRVLHKLAVELDKCIQENNGLITAATP